MYRDFWKVCIRYCQRHWGIHHDKRNEFVNGKAGNWGAGGSPPWPSFWGKKWWQIQGAELWSLPETHLEVRIAQIFADWSRWASAAVRVPVEEFPWCWSVLTSAEAWSCFRTTAPFKCSRVSVKCWTLKFTCQVYKLWNMRIQFV